MINQEGAADRLPPISPIASEVVELRLLLSQDQFSALEDVAGQVKMTMGQLLRRTVSDFLQHLNSTNSGKSDMSAFS